MDKLQQILKTTPAIASIIENTLDVRVDFTPASLRRIDKALNRVYPTGHQPIATTLISYGIYLGEVFARNVPGTQWGPYSDDILSWHFKCSRDNRNFVGYPVMRVHNFWHDRSLSLFSYFQMNVDALEGKLEMEVSEEWKNNNGEYQYRFPLMVRKDK